MLNIKEQIMDKQMHQFIYLDDVDKRKNVVDEIKNLDPTNVIILDEFGTKPYKLHENCRKNVFNGLHRQFLYFSIVHKLVCETEKYKYDNDAAYDLIELINMMYLSNDMKYVRSLDDLKKQLYTSKETYKMCIEEYSLTGELKFDFDKLLIPKVDIINVSTKAKRLFNEYSNMLILLNHEKEISLGSTETVNDLIFTKINRNFSVKLFTDENNWKSITTDTGQWLTKDLDFEELNINKLIKN